MTMKHLTDDTFDKETSQGLVLVDFYADWCGPCKMMAPVLEQVAKELEGKATIAKLDIEHAQATAAKFNISSVPTLILFKDGQKVKQLVGVRDANAVKEFITAS